MNWFRFACGFLLICSLAGLPAHAADSAADRQQFLIKLRAAIVKDISTPCGIKPTQRIELKVLLQDNGYVQGMGLVQSSGAAAFDAAVMVAIAKAQPYKLPADPAARKDLQNLNLKFDAFAMPIPPCKGKG